MLSSVVLSDGTRKRETECERERRQCRVKKGNERNERGNLSDWRKRGNIDITKKEESECDRSKKG